MAPPEHKIGVFVSETAIFPWFGSSRVQNRHFCALLPFGTPIFGQFEHKIGFFVRFYPPKPPFSGISSTKTAFLCQKRRYFPGFGSSRAQKRHFCARADGELALGSVTAETFIVNVAFLQITAHASKMQISHNQIINFYQRAR